MVGGKLGSNEEWRFQRDQSSAAHHRPATSIGPIWAMYRQLLPYTHRVNVPLLRRGLIRPGDRKAPVSLGETEGGPGVDIIERLARHQSAPILAAPSNNGDNADNADGGSPR
ncbi:hypothetical protein KM043_016247 [Ampulex compressa]|nr:hypothetical protein KM043_016247 [Ampulex compressa]